MSFRPLSASSCGGNTHGSRPVSYTHLIAAALLPLPYLAVHIATWRKMVRIDHGEELNVCLGETARNILLFGALLTAGILLDKILC